MSPLSRLHRAGRLAGGLTITLAALTAVGRAQAIEPRHPDIVQGGRVVALAVSPTSPATILAASESGGLFRSADGGRTWTHLDRLVPFRMADVAFAPDNDRIVIATAWSDSHVLDSGGVWRSEDGGTTWNKPAGSRPEADRCAVRAHAAAVAFAPDGPEVYVATECGLAVSRDRGVTWRYQSGSALGTRLWAVAAAPGGGVHVCGDNGYVRSSDRALRWDARGTLPAGCMEHAPHTIAVSPLDAGVVFVTTNARQVYASSDGGGTWRDLGAMPPATPPRPAWLRARAVPQTRDRIELFFGNGVGLRKTTCTSGTGVATVCDSRWSTVGADHDDANDLGLSAAAPCPVLLATDGGVHRTENCGGSWAMAGGGRGGMNALQLYEVKGQVAGGHTDLYIGSQDNNLWASPDGGLRWPAASAAEGFIFQTPRHAASHDGQHVTFFACRIPCANLVTQAHFASEVSWNNPDGTQPAANPYVLAPDVYFQYGIRAPTVTDPIPEIRLYRTDDAGAHWRILAPMPWPLMGSPQVAGPASDPVIYQPVLLSGTPLGSDERVGLARITGVRTAAATVTVLPGRGLSNLGVYPMGQGTFGWPRVWAVDPQDPGHLIAADAGDGQMKVSDDGGMSWAPEPQLTRLVTGNGELHFAIGASADPARAAGIWLQPHAVAFDPEGSGRVVVGTEAAGLIYSLDNGHSWDALPDSRRLTSITSIFFGQGDSLFVSTYGRGLWLLHLRGTRARAPVIVDVNTVIDGGTILETHSNAIVTPRQLRDPDFCTVCTVAAAVGGRITNVRFDGDAVREIAIDGGELRAVTLKGDPAPLDAKVSSSAQVGGFDNCQACLTVLKQDGAIRALVLEKGTLRALVYDTGGGTDGANATAPSQPPQSPALILIGTVPITGQPTAAAGDTVDVYGTGFCGDPGCPAAELTVDGSVVLEDVKRTADGTFHVRLAAPATLGAHVVVAAQHAAGAERRAGAALIVAPFDRDRAADERERPAGKEKRP